MVVAIGSGVALGWMVAVAVADGTGLRVALGSTMAVAVGAEVFTTVGAELQANEKNRKQTVVRYKALCLQVIFCSFINPLNFDALDGALRASCALTYSLLL